MLFVLFKHSLISTHSAHFAGGKHAFLCMAHELAREGHEVHVVTVSSKGQLMVSAVQGGRPCCDLASLAGAPPPPSPDTAPTVSWRERVQAQSSQDQGDRHVNEQDGKGEQAVAAAPRPAWLTYHAVLNDQAELYQQDHQQRLQGRDAVGMGVLHTISCILAGGTKARRQHGHGPQQQQQQTQQQQEQQQQQPIQQQQQQQQQTQQVQQHEESQQQVCWVVLDADDSQLDPSRPPASASPTSTSTPEPAPAESAAEAAASKPSGNNAENPARDGASLFESIVSRWGRMCIALVQNVHFLPFGPSGTAPRSASLLQAWSRLGCVMCVSHFIRDYLLEHAPPGTFPAPSPPTFSQSLHLQHQRPPHSQQQQEQQQQQQQQQQQAKEEESHRPHVPSNASRVQVPISPPSPLLLPPLLSSRSVTASSQGPTLHTASSQGPTIHTAPAADAAAVSPASSRPTPHTKGLGAELKLESEMQAPYIIVVPLSAWQCFGSPPFPNFGSGVASNLATECPISAAGKERTRVSDTGAGIAAALHLPPPSSSASGPPGAATATPGPFAAASAALGTPAAASASQQPQPQQLSIGVLKLSPEKGCSIVLEAARQLPHRSFLAVAGDPRVADVAVGLSNLQVVEPASNIDTLLCRMSVVLAPSLWLEAWGMVVTEAMLRGLPVVVSNAGGLPEAALGVGHVVPVQPIHIPEDPATRVPDWGRRTYPKQQVEGWVEAIESLLSKPAKYAAASAACRAAATAFVAAGPMHRAQTLTWLHALGKMLCPDL